MTQHLAPMGNNRIGMVSLLNFYIWEDLCGG